MSLLIRPLTLARPASECLTGGKSPAQWGQLTEQSAMAAGWFLRSCTWTGFLSRAVPRLQTGPLFGSGIDALTSVAPHRAIEQQPRTGHRRFTSELDRQFPSSRVRFAGVPPARRAASAERKAGTVTRQSDPKRAPANNQQKSPRALRELLTRLAGPAFTVPEHGQVRTHSERARQLVEILEQKEARAGRGVKEVDPSDAAIETLVRTTGQRAAAALAAPGAAGFAEQWRMPLTGPQAPGELLAAAAPSGGTAHTTTGTTPRVTGDRVSSRDDSPPSESGAKTRLSPELFRTETLEDAAAAAWEAEKESVAGLAAMPLQPLTSTSRRWPRPVAAPSGGGAESCGEDTMSDEELSDLSSKIKRILEEEARRHGINV